MVITKKFDEQQILELLQQPERPTDEEIAGQVGCSREWVRQKRHDFEKRNLIEPRPAKRRGIKVVAVSELSLDGTIDLIIKAFSALKQLPELLAELDKYKRGYSNALEQLALYEKDSKKRQGQEMTFKLAQQGNIPGLKALKRANPNPNLTYHI